MSTAFSVELEDGSTVEYHDYKTVEEVETCAHHDPDGDCDELADYVVAMGLEGSSPKLYGFCEEHFDEPADLEEKSNGE